MSRSKESAGGLQLKEHLAAVSNAEAPDGELPLAASVALQIESLILDGVLTPGSKLGQQQIGEALGISRTPVREALLLLQARGLVTMTPNRGAAVRRVTRRDAAETYLVRAELEGLAAELAAERVSPQELRELSELNRELERSAEPLLRESAGGDEKGRTEERRQARLQWLEANDRIHEALLRVARCNRLTEVITSLLSRLPRTVTWFAIEQNIIVLKRYHDEHEEIIDALRARDPERARRAARDHVMHARELMLTWLDSVDEDLTHW